MTVDLNQILQQSQNQKTQQATLDYLLKHLHPDIDPSVGAAQLMSVLEVYGKSKPDNPMKHLEKLKENSKAIQDGDLSLIEEMLFTQSVTLLAMFTNFSKLAVAGIGTGAKTELISSLMQIALKSQDQSRKTLLALMELKNPKKAATFVKNQVNQLAIAPMPNHQHSLEESHYAALDIGSTATATAIDSELATVAAVNGPNKRGRKGKVKNERTTNG